MSLLIAVLSQEMFMLTVCFVSILSWWFYRKNNKKNLHRVTEAENLALFYHCGVFYRLKGSCMNFVGRVVCWRCVWQNFHALKRWNFTYMWPVMLNVLYCIHLNTFYLRLFYSYIFWRSHCTLWLICWMKSKIFLYG